MIRDVITCFCSFLTYPFSVHVYLHSVLHCFFALECLESGQCTKNEPAAKCTTNSHHVGVRYHGQSRLAGVV